MARLDRRQLIAAGTSTIGLLAFGRTAKAVLPPPPSQILTFPLNSRSNLGVYSSAGVSAVDVINNLRQGVVYLPLDNIPVATRSRSYDFSMLPNTGSGNLGLPAFGAVSRQGTIIPVDQGGQAVAASGQSGLSFTGGAYLQSLGPIPASLYLSGGWALSITLRAPVGVKNSGAVWASMGRRQASNYGITIGETSGGALFATIEDPRQSSVQIVSAAYPRGQTVSAVIAWSAITGMGQWSINGQASGNPVALGFLPELGNGQVQIATNLALSPNVSPHGAVYNFSFTQLGSDSTQSMVPIGPSITLTPAQAASLLVDTTDIFSPVQDVGSISFGFVGPNGYTTMTSEIAFAGYVQADEVLTSFISGEMPYVPISLGQTRSDLLTLVLTPPSRGKIQTTGGSRVFAGPGSLVPVNVDGIAPTNYVLFQPIAGGTGPGQNPNGSTLRGSTDVLRTQQEGKVRLTNIVEMNRAPRLNGGGEAWGHTVDIWVPIHALWYGYLDGSLLFPTIDNEILTIMVTAVPGPGEGVIRVGRTGPNLSVGSTISQTDLQRVGWYKPGVGSVSPQCRLGLSVSAAGSPVGEEDYFMKMTDASRPEQFRWWDQADTNYSDKFTRIRWANRGGDWVGQDGLWGVMPFAISGQISMPGLVKIDVTSMVKSVGADFFLSVSGLGTVTIFPGLSTTPSQEPVLRVMGGVSAGDYRPTRSAGLTPSDGTGWAPVNTASFPCKGSQPLLLAFDGVGQTRDAQSIQLILTVTNASSGGGAIQVFHPSAQPPRPGPRVAVTSTPTGQRSDLLVKVETNADWLAMLNGVNGRLKAGAGQPTNFTVANGCYYGGIPQGQNTGLNLLNGFWDANNQGYTTVRFGRMVGWHINYQPSDANLLSGIGVSGKSPGVVASQNTDLSSLGAGYGGRSISGLSAYTCRMERGSPTQATHPSTSPLAGLMAFGDYDYFLSGNTNGVTTNGINPVPRMKWVWIETVHQANSLHPDGTWANDGVFELYVNGRKQCESRRLEWRVPPNTAGWDTIWFDEYNGGQTVNQVDRLWPFCLGSAYVVNGTAPIAPPPGWNVPFVTAAGTPDTVALAYSPNF